MNRSLEWESKRALFMEEIAAMRKTLRELKKDYACVFDIVENVDGDLGELFEIVRDIDSFDDYEETRERRQFPPLCRCPKYVECLNYENEYCSYWGGRK